MDLADLKKQMQSKAIIHVNFILKYKEKKMKYIKK
jgi:hypothetical protein